MSRNDILKSFNFAKDVLQASKKSFSAGITLTDNYLKDIIKVIKSLENRGILYVSWFTINEKCTHCIW